MDKEPNTISYLLPGPNQDNDKGMSIRMMQQLKKEFKNVFNGIACFNRTFFAAKTRH